MPIGTPTGFVNFTNGTPRADKIIATSNIGVGTNTPSYTLDVAGDINFSGSLYENGVAFSGGGIDTTQTLALTNETTGLTVSSNAVVSGNVTAESFIGNTLTLNTVTITTTLGLDEVLNVSNTTTNTIRITNTTDTALDVTGGASIQSNLKVGTANLFVDTTTGNVGVGVSQPTSRFEVAGNETLQEYPPKAMTANETYIPGHGVFRASASSLRNGHQIWHAFEKTITYKWPSDAGGGDTFGGTDTAYNGTNRLSSSTELGAWLKLSLPYKICLKSFSIYTSPTSEQPEDFIVYGSTDDNVWEYVFSETGAPQNSDYVTYSVNSTSYYKYFAIVITRTISSTTIGTINEWKLFGTPAPSALEDGHLTLGKALTLPRVSGHPAGAETPRAESLVVHYDTTVDSVVSGTTAVDISGEGNNGTLRGNTFYSSSMRSFDFDGLGADYILSSSPSGLPTGDAIYSISGWVKVPSSITTACNLLSYGSSWGCSTIASLFIRTDYKLAAGIGCDYVYSTNAVITSDTWHHVAIVKKSTGVIDTSKFDLYVDGVAITNKSVNGGTRTLSIGSTTSLAVGGGFTGAASDLFNGSISNPKLWDVALTTEEVAMEYALGRTGKSINLTDTALCLGGTVPRAQLDVRGSALFAGNVGFGKTDPASRMHLKQASDQSYLSATLGSYQNGLIFERHGTTNRWTFAHDDAGSMCFFYDTTRTGYLLAAGSDGRVNFTGQHRTFIKDVPFMEAGDLEGLIVSADNNKYIKMSGGIEAGSNAITTNESLPVVSLSTIVNDKKCFGVISASEDPETRQEVHGNFVSDQEKELGDTRVYINSVGEGAIWVVNTAGPLESGDYITTSNVAGYGQRQDDDVLHNYTVAKITMDCDFDPVTQPIQVIKKDEDGVNVLDEHGQLQWEDHPTETEKAYKIRYLDATGVQTDEANALYIAAFVGCTYHCG